MEFSEHEKLIEIGRNLASEAPEDWLRIEVDVFMLAEVSTSSVEVFKEDGSREFFDIPFSASMAFRELREGMHTAEYGTWFSAQYSLEKPGRFKVEYDYDNEPPFPYPLDSERYANDYLKFPRALENIPEWLFGKFEECKRRERERIEDSNQEDQ
ncbi:hypothetical protein GCM10007079_46080 [Nocardiopsis terrae]|uniref:Immunity protein Imm1 n=1 Tax=Nocardiopsis terrae TaxID=372655 RepID=A0ABR9HL53_9ACTN|nr:immunity protein YezG family protein [Nocardiopsis terrae]MBE1459585.1 hypothetical protein [Nocardiopsis terrae]GHC94978.1 hypothetical protein GCM10007079_46080 [Nocardiopsis terrae]